MTRPCATEGCDRLANDSSSAFPCCGRCADERAAAAEAVVHVRAVHAGEDAQVAVHGGCARKPAPFDGVAVRQGDVVIFVPVALLQAAGVQVKLPRRRKARLWRARPR